jgi:multidrug efflux pump subunit AcrA (membrane-fusion protein)
VAFDLDQKTFGRLRADLIPGRLEAAVAVGFDGEDGFQHAAAIDSVEPQADPKTGAVRVRVVFPNPDRKVIPGMTARVRVATPSPK